VRAQLARVARDDRLQEPQDLARLVAREVHAREAQGAARGVRLELDRAPEGGLRIRLASRLEEQPAVAGLRRRVVARASEAGFQRLQGAGGIARVLARARQEVSGALVARIEREDLLPGRDGGLVQGVRVEEPRQRPARLHVRRRGEHARARPIDEPHDLRIDAEDRAHVGRSRERAGRTRAGGRGAREEEEEVPRRHG